MQWKDIYYNLVSLLLMKMTIFKQISYSIQWQTVHLQQIQLFYFPGLKWIIRRELEVTPTTMFRTGIIPP